MKKVLLGLLIVLSVLICFVGCSSSPSSKKETEGKTGTIYYPETYTITDSSYKVIKCDGKGYFVRYEGSDSFRIRGSFDFNNGTVQVEENSNSFSIEIEGDNVTVTDSYNSWSLSNKDSITITSDITDSGFKFKYGETEYKVDVPNVEE